MNYTLVNNNNVTLSSGIINSGANFDGTNYLSNSGFLIPSSGFTLSTWVKSDSYPEGSVIVGQWNYDNNSPVMAAINCNFGVINVLWSTDGASLTDRWQTPIALSSIADNKWHHLAFTYASNTGKIYLDSSFAGETTLTPAKPSSGISLGMGYNGFFNGQIDETAVWNRSLSNQEVYNIYYSGQGNSYPFEKPVIESKFLDRCIGYWKLDDDGSGKLSLADSTSYGNTLQSGSNSNKPTLLVTGKISGAANFSSSNYQGNYLSSTGFSVGGLGEVSVSTWIKTTDNGGDGKQILGSWGGSFGGAAILLNMYYGNVQFAVNSTLMAETTAGYYADGDWHHLVGTYNGVKASFYVDGSFIGSSPCGGLLPQTTRFGIGIADGSRFFSGIIDEVGVWARGLTEKEAYNLYYQGTGNSYPFDNEIIDVPVSLIGIPRPKAYWKLDDDGSGNLSLIDSTINRYHLSGYGDTGILTSGKISSGVLTEGNSWFRSTVPTTVRNDTTYSFWIKSPVPSEPYAMILDETEGFGVLGNTNGTFSLVNSYDQTFISGGDFSDGDWHHVAAARGNNKLKLFVDGTLIDFVNFPGWSYINSGEGVSVLGVLPEGLSKAPSGTIIDEIGVWASGLNEKEINNLYYNGQANTYPFVKPVIQTSGLKDQIIAYYKLDNTGNGLPSMLDSTPNKNNLSNNDGVTAASGIIGSGANFEIGSTMLAREAQMYYIGNQVPISPNGISVSFWIKPTRYEAKQSQFYTKEYNTYIGVGYNEAEELALSLKRDGTISLSTYIEPYGAYYHDENTGYVIPLNEWTHIVLVANTPYGNLDLYINGQYISAFTNLIKDTQSFNLNSLYSAGIVLGNGYFGTRCPYGVIDEVGLWNKPLTTSEIYNLYYNGLGNSYPFDKPTIEPVIVPTRTMPALMNEVLAYYPFNPSVSFPSYFETVDYTRNNNTIQLGSPSDRFSIQSGIIGSGAGFTRLGVSIPTIAAPLIRGTSGYNSLASNTFGDTNTLAVSGFAVSFWASPISYPAPHSEYFALANPKISFRMTTGSGISLGVGNSFQNEGSRYIVPTGRWTHFVLNSNAPSGNFDLHVNGVYLSSFTVGSGVQYFDLDSAFVINRGGFLKGTIDEFGLWSRPLSTGDISNLYYQGSGNSYPFNKTII